MKTLKFESDLVLSVLLGQKTSTWRLFDDKDLKEGDELILINKENSEEFAKAKINTISQRKLGDLANQDFEGHEKYKDQKDILADFKKYYGEKVSLDTIVKIINFKLL